MLFMNAFDIDLLVIFHYRNLLININSGFFLFQ